MSGTPRLEAGIGVLPAGRTLWYDGRAKVSLKPPPENVQATSAACAALNLALPHLAPRPASGIGVRAWNVVAFGSVHRYVPPTPVTSGSEAGHSTAGCGISAPPCATGCFVKFVEPSSPDEPSTVTPLAAACSYAYRRLSSDALLPNASSLEANDCEMTW